MRLSMATARLRLRVRAESEGRSGPPMIHQFLQGAKQLPGSMCDRFRHGLKDSTCTGLKTLDRRR